MSTSSKANTCLLDEQAIDALHAMVSKAAAIVDLVEHMEGMDGAPFYALWAAREQLEAAEAILADALRLPPGLVPAAAAWKLPPGFVWINSEPTQGTARRSSARAGKKGGGA